MKFIMNRQAFLSILNIVGPIAQARTPKPVLRCVKIVADKGSGVVRLHTTDGELSAHAHTGQVDVQASGDICVFCADLLKIVDGERDETLAVALEDGLLRIRSSDAAFRLHGLPASDFPDTEAVTGETTTIPASDFVRGVESTEFAISTEQTRYAYAGLFLRSDGRATDFVATDGHRLAWNRLPIKGGKHSAIIPPKFIRTALRVASKMPEPIKLTTNDSSITAVFGHAGDPACVTLTSVLVSGTFPPFEDVTPAKKNATVFMYFDREKMIDAVQRASRLMDVLKPGVILAFEGSGCEILAADSERGDSVIRIETTRPVETPHKFKMKAAYLLDGLQALTKPEVAMDFKEAKAAAPCCFREDGYTHVAMPSSMNV